ncbi:hypothetical protein B0H11DRAFT_2265908 [Mycena galericulata]|nr:hypothetical protein B0H11DRAFT_2265908 [Mycena galericulata]
MAKVSLKVFDEVSTMEREVHISFYPVSLMPGKKISVLSPGVKHVARLVRLTDPKQGDRGAMTTRRTRLFQLGHGLCTPHPGPFIAYRRLSDPDTDTVLTDIHVPPLARILKSIFAWIHPDLEAEKQDAQYLQFRNYLDKLTAIHLDSSLSLSHQDEDSLKIVIKDLVKEFPWLARCTKTWPVTVCLQGKLHNSAARNSEMDTRKLLTSIKGLKGHIAVRARLNISVDDNED